MTERPFEDGERHVSLLQVQDGALERVDLSMDAWREQRAKIDAKDADEPLFYWVTRHEVERKKTVQLDMESLDRLFVQLEGRGEREVRELRYVLCLLLMRKRRVKVERVVRKDGEESFLVKRPREDTRYTVYVYDFEPEQLEHLRAQLQAVFDGAEGPHGVRLEDSVRDADGGSSAADSAAESAAESEPESAADAKAGPDAEQGLGAGPGPADEPVT